MENKVAGWLRAMLVLAVAAAAVGAPCAEPVTIAFQTGVDPTKVAQAAGDFEKATGAPIRWRRFDSGAEAIAAIASGDVAIANLGSSPLAAASSRGLPIQVFLIASELGDSEALVVRQGSGITRPQELRGHRLAVPYVSTTHYSLLAALQHWGVAASELQIVNLRPSEIPAAWQRGDIDAAYVWEPALGRIKASGTVLVSSAQVARWGSPTYDLWVVRNDFARSHEEFLTRFVRAAGDVLDRFNRDPAAFAADRGNLDRLAEVTGAGPQDARQMLLGNRYPSLRVQADLLQAPFAQTVQQTARFLQSQGKIERVLDDYGPYVSNRYVQAAIREAGR